MTEMPEQIQQIKAGYEFAGGALAFGAAVLSQVPATAFASAMAARLLISAGALL